MEYLRSLFVAFVLTACGMPMNSSPLPINDGGIDPSPLDLSCGFRHNNCCGESHTTGICNDTDEDGHAMTCDPNVLLCTKCGGSGEECCGDLNTPIERRTCTAPGARCRKIYASGLCGVNCGLVGQKCCEDSPDPTLCDDGAEPVLNSHRACVCIGKSATRGTMAQVRVQP